MIVSKSVEIEQYKPTRCFRCSAAIYIRPLEVEDNWVKLIPYNFMSNSRHICMKLEIDEEITIKKRA